MVEQVFSRDMRAFAGPLGRVEAKWWLCGEPMLPTTVDGDDQAIDVRQLQLHPRQTVGYAAGL